MCKFFLDVYFHKLAKGLIVHNEVWLLLFQAKPNPSGRSSSPAGVSMSASGPSFFRVPGGLSSCLLPALVVRL